MSHEAFRVIGEPVAVRFRLDGEEVTGRAGQSVASALLERDVAPYRRTGTSGAPRAPYCMTGACFDCLVEINGVRNRQGCMVTLAEGMRVRRQVSDDVVEARGTVISCNDAPLVVPAPDVVIIGAGPAGLAAAADLAEAGIRVLVVDEQAAPGGQIFRGAGRQDRPRHVRRVLGREAAHGAALIQRVKTAGVEIWSRATVWHVEADRSLWISRDGRSVHLAPRVLILATGSRERPVPLPGWTLPNVMTAGALQVCLKGADAVPAGRVVLVGAGPLLLLVASQCLKLGVDLVAVVETARRPPFAALVKAALRAVATGGMRELLRGVVLINAIRRAGIPIVSSVTDVAIHGGDRVQRVTFTHRRRAVEIACDVVGLHEGVAPDVQLARLAGCAMDWDDATRSLVPRQDRLGVSSVPDVILAGDGAGIEGARAAEARGHLAALAALHRLGRIGADERDGRAVSLLRERHAATALRPLLDLLYPPSRDTRAIADETLACRCEEVTAGTIRAVVAAGACGADEVKGLTRCGMGPCQGRQCSATLTDLIAEVSGQSPAGIGLARVRTPIKPVSAGEIAGIGAP